MTTTIKLSKETIEVLSNFAGMNPGILLKQGSIQKTKSSTGSEIAVSTIKETFPKDFAIFNFSSFLSILKELPDAEIEFSDEDNFVKITEKGSSFKFYGADKSMVSYPEKDIKFPEEEGVNFVLTQDILSKVLKFSSIASLPDVSIYSVDGKIKIKVYNSDSSTSENKYEIELGDNSTEAEFNIMFAPETLKFIPGDYSVRIVKNSNNRVISRFTNNARDLVYYVAPNIKSTFA